MVPPDAMDTTDAQEGLVGRDREVGRLSLLLEAATHGESAVLVVRGDAGVGKTALLEHVVALAPTTRVLRAVGVESEMELAFAALHQLCGPVLDRLDGLPGPQRDALGTVFGLLDGPTPDRLVVGLAALSLLAGVGAERAVVCLVDDAQWLDDASAQALAFVARRLHADPVVVLFATRARVAFLGGLPELALQGLGDHDARLLFDSEIPFLVDGAVRERIIAESAGNPLALIELPRGMSPPELGGGFSPAGAKPVTTRIEETFRHRLDALPGA